MTDELEPQPTSQAEEPEEETPDPAVEVAGAEEEDVSVKLPKPKLERLQKILAAAGVASRRKAEELITEGRVQVNGTVVTELGTKADMGRDHIRVDGKLLHGPERLRYFVLNKPKGYVTTVSDPEGRPTVMQFFAKMGERLYPVGRLDYLSEGLLLVTNDGDLAHRLTRAASGVEKTYLVKVAGQPTDEEIERLRGGVFISKGEAGSDRVRSAPARIRQIRVGENPWYEVVLIEGRNRELRKMFEEVGHHVEKIRRVGYGPLVLDQEPGSFRELEAEELVTLRLAAEGKLRAPRSKELRKRAAIEAASLPTVKPRMTPKARTTKPFEERREGEVEIRPTARRAPERRPERAGDRPRRFGSSETGSARPVSGRPAARTTWKKNDRPARPAARFSEAPARAERPARGKPFGERPAAARSFGAKPAWKRPEAGTGSRPSARPGAKPAFRSDRPSFKRPAGPPRDVLPVRDREDRPAKPSKLHIEEIGQSERIESVRPFTPRAAAPRTGPPRSSSARPAGARPPISRPFKSEGGLPRPYTTSSGKPRAGGARPSSTPAKPGTSKPFGAGSSTRPPSAPRKGSARTGSGYRATPGGTPSFGSAPSARASRPFSPRGEGATGAGPARKSGAGWKPKPSFGGPGKPAAPGRSKPKASGFSKSGFKGKPSGPGPRRSGSRPGGKPGGKKRG